MPKGRMMSQVEAYGRGETRAAKGHIMSKAERENRMAATPLGPRGSTGKQARKGKRHTSRSQAVRQGYRG